MSGTVTVPGVSSSTLTLSFVGTANLGLAQQISNALAQASGSSKLDVVNYTGGPVPVLPSGDTLELVLNSSVVGSITVPPPALGVAEVLVLQNTAPLTISGSPGLEIIGQVIGDGGNVSVIDPTIVDFSFNAASANTDAVTVQAADLSFDVAMRAGNESVEVLGGGSGTIYGGSAADNINLTAATGDILVVTQASVGGDNVFAGAGTTTIQNLPSAIGALDEGGSGALFVNDLGLNDQIVAGSTSTVVTLGGGGAVVFGGKAGSTLTALVTGGSGAGGGDEVNGGSGAVSVTASSSANGMLVYGGIGALTVFDSGTNSFISGGKGALSATLAGVGAALAASSGVTSVDASSNGSIIYGGKGALTVDATGNAETILGGAAPASSGVAITATGGSNVIAVGSGGASIVASGASNTIFGGSGVTSIDAAGSSGLLLAGGSGAETVDATTATTALVYGPSGGLDFLGGTAGATVVGEGGSNTVSGNNNVIAAGSGAMSIGASGSADLIFGGSGAVSIDASGSTNATIGGGGGTETVNAGTATNLLVFGASGGLDYIGGAGTGATVVGESTSNTVTGGSAGLTFTAGLAGNFTVFGGSGGATLVGATGQDFNYSSTLAGASMFAGTGNETLNASLSTISDALSGGTTPSDADLLVAGSGNDTLIAGSGSDTMVGGSGADLFAFVKSVINGAGNDSITGFTTKDQAALYGYNSPSDTNAAAAAVNSATVAGGNTTISLADGTHIEFVGFTGLTTNNIFST